uniref:Uncharacterized protein n=1 Tax=Globodera rostochiensis TaxID=31243 RepID=A0A914HLY2_GLORO
MLLILLFFIHSTAALSIRQTFDDTSENVENNFKLEGDRFELIEGKGWVENPRKVRKVAEWARAKVCNLNGGETAPLRKLVNVICSAGDHWRYVVKKDFGGKTGLIQIVTNSGQKILQKLHREEAKATEAEKMIITKALRGSMKKVSEKMPEGLGLEAFYASNKQNSQYFLGSDILGAVINKLWPAMIEQLLIKSKVEQIGEYEKFVVKHPKMLAVRKKRQMDTIILMIALLIGGTLGLGLIAHAIAMIVQLFLSKAIVICCVVAIIVIILLQLK